MLQDSRSYSGTAVITDHKLVKAVIKLTREMKSQKSKSVEFNIDKLRDTETQKLTLQNLEKV